MNSEEMRGAYVQEREPTEDELKLYHAQVKALQLEGRVYALENTPIFDRLAEEIHPVNVQKGFWGKPEMMDKYAAKLALIHSEVTEVLEALRKSQGSDKVTEEFADIFIRCIDLYGALVDAGEADPDLYKVMIEKMETNKNRPPKHGNRWG
jgi:NTP pyrophosphatase (non-canonical NTP hydrolase)